MALTDWFEWNGVKSSELGSTYGLNDVDYQLVVRKAINIPSPARKTNVYKIAGRTGDFVVPTDSWENIKIDIDLFLYCTEAGQDNLHKFCRAISEWLNGGKTPGGYNELTLCESSGYYEAYFTGPYNVENLLYEKGKATISFNANPKHYVEYDAYRYRQSTDQQYDGEHLMYSETSAGRTEWIVDVENETAHNSQPIICVQQPDLSASYGSAQVYPFMLTIGERDSYFLSLDFTGRGFPDGNTTFKNVVIDSNTCRVRVTNAVMDSQTNPKHIKTAGVNSITRMDFVSKENSPNNSDFPWCIAGQTTRIAVTYYKNNNGVYTYYNTAPQLIAVEPRRWTL